MVSTRGQRPMLDPISAMATSFAHRFAWCDLMWPEARFAQFQMRVIDVSGTCVKLWPPWHTCSCKHAPCFRACGRYAWYPADCIRLKLAKHVILHAAIVQCNIAQMPCCQNQDILNCAAWWPKRHNVNLHFACSVLPYNSWTWTHISLGLWRSSNKLKLRRRG